MNKVITINLNGNAYQLEEPGYNALHAYLEKASAKLADNPDKDEIVADFEQAIADKCAKYVHANKSVITVQEIASILSEMGPVQDAQEAMGTEATVSDDAPKRLFRIRKGAMIEGICNGFATYFNIDPTIVRIVFVLLTILTGGAWAIAYLVMVFIIPEAKTAEDIAKAQGKEFNAQTVMQNAKERYEYWVKFGKEQADQWQRKNPKKSDDSVSGEPKEQLPEPPAKKMPTLADIDEWRYGHAHGHSPFLRTIAGIFGALGVITLLGLGVAWIVGVVHILNNGNILGYFQGAHVGLIALLYSCLFYLLFLPLQGFTGQAIHYAKNYPSVASFWATFMTTFLWLAALGGIVAVAAYSSPIQEGLRQIKHDYEHTGTIGR